MRQLVNNLPIITVIVLFFSFLNLHFFYGSFGIAAQNYLDVSEIVFSMTTFVSSAVTLILFCLFINIALFSRKKSNDNDLSFKKGNNLSISLRSSKYQIVRYASRLVEPGSVLIAFYSGFIWTLIYIINSFTNEQLLASAREFDFYCYLLVFVTSGYVMLIQMWIRRAKDIKRKDLNTFLLALPIGCIVFLSVRNSIRTDFIKSGFPTHKVSLQLNDHQKVESTDSVFYIGSVKNYYFFYRNVDSSSVAIPATRVEKAIIRRIRNGL